MATKYSGYTSFSSVNIVTLSYGNKCCCGNILYELYFLPILEISSTEIPGGFLYYWSSRWTSLRCVLVLINWFFLRHGPFQFVLCTFFLLHLLCHFLQKHQLCACWVIFVFPSLGFCFVTCKMNEMMKSSWWKEFLDSPQEQSKTHLNIVLWMEVHMLIF